MKKDYCEDDSIRYRGGMVGQRWLLDPEKPLVRQDGGDDARPITLVPVPKSVNRFPLHPMIVTPNYLLETRN